MYEYRFEMAVSTLVSTPTCGTCIALVAGLYRELRARYTPAGNTSYHSDGLEVRRNREILARMIPGNIRRMQYGLHGKKSRVLLVGLLVRMGGSAEQPELGEGWDGRRGPFRN